MAAIALVLFFILVGHWLHGRWPQGASKLANSLQTLNLYLLAALALCLFAHPWRIDQVGVPLLLGFALQGVPALLAVRLWRGRPGLARDLLIFSTYGGGNRGVLLLTLVLPAWLPLFVMVDMGNFLSLLVLFPVLARRLESAVEVDALRRQRAWRDVALLASAMLVGLGVGQWRPGSLSGFEAPIQQALAVAIPLYLGLQFRLGLFRPGALARRLLAARGIGVGMVGTMLALAWLLGAPGVDPGLFPLLLVFLLLPVSSMAPAFLPAGALRDQTVADAVATAALFVPLLLLVSLGAALLGGR